ncbi:MAG: ParB N-terminal domain-containing protein [Candidatus Thermoplasmatota archaeon]|nr:ParB N-terminal domain-containing protein [Candidatus Thermoplasmatota archaeon]MEC8045709.1 ParB N-terminal domain-containing protein [Candidatus Thermoplasmatota archaeon]MEC9137186.1 ParB N-terminal domain-containing protein [Candidatus Thermoplasmatota archaeon]MED5303782.1 ParB N-terminal domain-containing protein [Candidatus Thermoplasmatota archaeon]
MRVQLIPVEVLKPHEQVIEKKVDQLERMTIRWDAYTKPLLVDGATGTILDGHHRYEIARRLDLQCLPCVVVEYLDDDSITLLLWPNSDREGISKDDVIQAGLSGDLMPPKTSRHLLSDDLPPISVPLSRLMHPAIGS